MEVLRRYLAPVRQPRLTPKQLAQAPALLERGPEAHGFRRQVFLRQGAAKRPHLE